MSIRGKTYWLIGASEGLGRALAGKLVTEGANVVISARNAERLAVLSAELPGSRYVVVDVTDIGSVRDAAIQAAPFDGVIYNAGAYEPMPATSWDTEAAIDMCNVNYLGALRVIGEVLPRFLRMSKGEITLIGSLAGYSGMPSAVGYGASKAALRSLAETMRHDLKGTGVIVRIVNPGFIKTRMTEKNTFAMPMLMSPDKAARHVIGAMKSMRLRTDFPRPFSWCIRTLNFAPDWLLFR